MSIGLKPLVRNDVLALRRALLSWVNQTFIRNKTLIKANACPVRRTRTAFWLPDCGDDVSDWLTESALWFGDQRNGWGISVLKNYSRVTAQALLIASSGSALWKLGRLQGVASHFKTQDYAKRNAK
jgi:hypothetical protein